MGMQLFFLSFTNIFYQQKRLHGARDNSNSELMTLRGMILSYLHIPEIILNNFPSLDGFPPEIPRQMLLLEVIRSWMRSYCRTDWMVGVRMEDESKPKLSSSSVPCQIHLLLLSPKGNNTTKFLFSLEQGNFCAKGSRNQPLSKY